MWRVLDKANRRHVAGYVLLNRSQAADFARRLGLDPTRLTVIPHGVLDDYLPASGAPPDIGALTGVAGSYVGRYVLFIGRIRPYKGLDTLLTAYAMLEDDQAGPLVIAGSGDLSTAETERLVALQDRPVHFVNTWLSDAEIAALVSGARFVVLPYLRASQTGVIPLASAFGIPAIASATDGLVEQVLDGVTGFLFPPGDASALCGLLAKALSMSDEAYGQMSSRCAEHARDNWGWAPLSSRLIRFCQTLVE